MGECLEPIAKKNLQNVMFVEDMTAGLIIVDLQNIPLTCLANFRFLSYCLLYLFINNICIAVPLTKKQCGQHTTGLWLFPQYYS